MPASVPAHHGSCHLRRRLRRQCTAKYHNVKFSSALFLPSVGIVAPLPSPPQSGFSLPGSPTPRQQNAANKHGFRPSRIYLFSRGGAADKKITVPRHHRPFQPGIGGSGDEYFFGCWPSGRFLPRGPSRKFHLKQSLQDFRIGPPSFFSHPPPNLSKPKTDIAQARLSISTH